MNPRFDFLFYVCVCIGMAVSTTSFTVLSGMSEAVTGSWMIASVLTSALLCFVIARLIGELSGAFPGSPGIRTYVLKGLGNRASIFTVLLYLILVVIFGSVESYMFALVVLNALPTVPAPLIVLSMIAAVTVINLRGLEMPRKMQIVTTIVLVAAIFGLGAAGLFIAPSALVPVPPERPLPETFALFFGSIGFALFLFVGFEWVVPLGRNANAFVNQIPRAMQIAVLINMVMYAVFTAGVLCHVSQVEMIAGIHPQILLGETLFGRTGTMIALAMSALAIISTFNAGVMGGARLIYAMAREGYFPAPLARVSLTTGTPTTAVMVLGGVVATVSMIVIIGHLEIVFAVIASSIICIVYILQIVSLIRLRQAGKTHFRYASRVPELGKWVIVFVLALFGTLGMFAVLSVWLQVTTGVAICVALAWFSTSLLEARRTAYS